MNPFKNYKSQRISLTSSFFWLLLIYGFFIGILQNSDLISVFSIKPNLILPYFIALAFAEINIKDYFFISVFTILVIKFFPGLDIISLTLLAFSVLIILSLNFLNKGQLQIFLMALVLTILFYILTDQSFFYGNFWSIFIESSLNALISLLLYNFLSWLKNKFNYV